MFERKILKRLEQFTKDLEKGDLSDYRITKVVKNDNSYTFIESYKGKIKKRVRHVKR